MTLDSADVSGSSRADAPVAVRRPYIDWARALAVLVMIEAHTFDAWTRLPRGRRRPFDM